MFIPVRNSRYRGRVTFKNKSPVKHTKYQTTIIIIVKIIIIIICNDKMSLPRTVEVVAGAQLITTIITVII